MNKRPETIDKTSGNNEECSKPYCLCQFKRKRRERYSMKNKNNLKTWVYQVKNRVVIGRCE